ncbi:MAG: urea ABC transporter substrate-binding protein [Treponema sp.]|nr:urea ABC transporter substrate-binding protein [Treponema sp.]
MKNFKYICAVFLLISYSFLLLSCNKTKEEKSIKIGLLHSLTGTMAMSEKAVRDAELLAINEINESGGILGKQIQIIEEDGQSNPEVFAQKAKKLIEEDGVVSIFGCWTSDSRKAVKAVVEEYYNLLWYPLQYEGIEASPNIMYMGASPNQQVVPAIDYCAKNIGKRMYLFGSDYIFPRTTNAIIKAQLNDIGGTCLAEKYVPLGHSDFSEIIEEIKELKPDIIINTLNGDSNISFFKSFKEAGFNSENLPVMSFSIAEEEIDTIGHDKLKGQLVSWNYFATTDSIHNAIFVSKYKKAYGQTSITSDPIEAGYIAINMWALACKKANSFDIEAVRIAAKGLEFDAPEGKVTIDGSNQHLSKTVRIGRINESGLIDEIWSTREPIKPDPYLSTYAWARGL